MKKAGIYDRWLFRMGGGEQMALAYATCLVDLGYEVEVLTHQKINLKEAEIKFGIKLSGVSLKIIPELPDYQLGEFTSEYDLFVCNSFLDYIPNQAKFGILSVLFPSKIKLSIFEYLKRALIVPILKQIFIQPIKNKKAYFRTLRIRLHDLLEKIAPKIILRLNGGPTLTSTSTLTSYQKIIAISKFTQKWIKIYWNLDSTILNPPVPVKNFYFAPKKENYILNVGRFFISGHNKKQLEMIQVFKRMFDQKKDGWSLHFAGSIEEGKIHQEYFDSIKKEAVGYPIFFHINLTSTELHDLMSKSKIYWHATGLDEDSEKDPIKAEHFGITTIEAMASGAVPIVINSGGQSEIVTKESGFLWNTREELISYTQKLIEEPEILEKMSRKAIEQSKNFSMDSFKVKLKNLLPD